MSTYTYSQLAAYQACARKYRYTYEEGWEPVYDGAPRPVGSAVHRGINALAVGLSRDEAADLARTRYFEDIPRQVYAQLEPKERESVDKGKAQVERIIERYPHVGPQHGKVEMVEQVLTTKMGHGRFYSGRIDQVIEVNGEHWVLDTKTTGQEWTKLLKVHRIRQQYVGYYLLGAELGIENLRGVIVDLVAKPRIYFRKDGDITYSGENFHREVVHVGPKDVYNFSAWFHRLAWLIEEDIVDEVWPMRAENCLAFNRVCPYFEACRMEDRASIYLRQSPKFKMRESEHPELEKGV